MSVTGTLTPTPIIQLFGNNGVPLIGGRVAGVAKNMLARQTTE